MVEAQTFFEYSSKYNVSGVPKIVINETNELLGNQPLEEYLNKIEAM
jgi:protein-disulfide isomerase